MTDNHIKATLPLAEFNTDPLEHDDNISEDEEDDPSFEGLFESTLCEITKRGDISLKDVYYSGVADSHLWLLAIIEDHPNIDADSLREHIESVVDKLSELQCDGMIDVTHILELDHCDDDDDVDRIEDYDDADYVRSFPGEYEDYCEEYEEEDEYDRLQDEDD